MSVFLKGLRYTHVLLTCWIQWKQTNWISFQSTKILKFSLLTNGGGQHLPWKYLQVKVEVFPVFEGLILLKMKHKRIIRIIYWAVLDKEQWNMSFSNPVGH